MRLARTARQRASGQALRITVFGSSTTEGYGASNPPATGYPPRMQAVLAPHFAGGVVLTNRGISGETIDGMAARVGDVVGDRANLVVWQAGSNDGPEGIPLARFERIMTDGVLRLRRASDLILMEPQYCAVLEASPAFPRFLDSIRSLGKREGVPVFPRYKFMQAWSVDTGLGIGGLSPDGMHMDDVGYRLLGEAVAHFILERS